MSKRMPPNQLIIMFHHVPNTCTHNSRTIYKHWELCTHDGSMYGIYANIWGILMVNATIYSIHGSYGVDCPTPFLASGRAWRKATPCVSARRRRGRGCRGANRAIWMSMDWFKGNFLPENHGKPHISWEKPWVPV